MSEKMLLSRYRLDEVIDGGATATVWRAYDTQLDRAVAIKILDRRRPGPLSGNDEDDQRRFRDEARALARLSHPHIVTVFDSGSTETGAGFLVMELVVGRSVSSRLADGVLPFVETAAILAQVCDGLAAAHAAGIVHRDIKPANIVVTSSGTAKVCDFGIARLHGTPSLTSPDIAVGTSSYMAPEQVSSQQVDGRADLYAVGCVLFEMLTGEPPFVGETALGIAYQHVNAQAPTLRSRRPDTPRELEALAAQLLAKDPRKRPADAAEVRAVLAAFVAARDTVAFGRRAGTNPGRFGNPRVRVAVAMAAVAALPAIAFVSWPEQRPERSSASEPGTLQGMPSTANGTSGPPHGTSPDPVATATPGPWHGPDEDPGGEPVTVPPGSAGPSSQATVPNSPGLSPASEPTPLQQVANLRSLVRRLESAGQLSAEDANDLVRMLNSLANSISQGMTSEAQDKIAAMRVRNDELLRDNRITENGHDRLEAGLVRLSAGL